MHTFFDVFPGRALGTPCSSIFAPFWRYFGSPREQLWAPGGVLGVTRHKCLRFFFVRVFYEKKLTEGSRGPPQTELPRGGADTCGEVGTHTFPHKNGGFT